MSNERLPSQQSGLDSSIILNNGSAYGFEGAARPSAISADYTRYEVKSGDTPSQIAESKMGNYRRWTEILQSDGTTITPEEARRIQVKEVLWLPPSTPTTSVVPKNITIVDSSPNPITIQAMPEGYSKYFVKPGDTPSDIAQSQLGNWRSWTEILQSDGTRIKPEETTKLQINEELWIPTRTQPEEPLRAALTAVVELSTEFYEYSIQSKDTRESIAKKLWGDSNLANLLMDNAGNLLASGSSLKAGERLIIPVSTLPADIFKGVGVSLPISSTINRALLTRKIEQAVVKYTPTIQAIANDFFRKPEIIGKLSNEAGFKAEPQISKALEDAGYKIFEVTPYAKQKGFDAIVQAPNGQIEFFEYKTTSKSGKAAEIEKLLPKDTKGLKQTSLGWIVDRAQRSLPKNNDPLVRQILTDAIQKPQNIPYKGVVVEKKTKAVKIFDRPPHSPEFKEITTPATRATGLNSSNSNADNLAKSIKKNVFDNSDDLVKGASKSGKASKALGIAGAAVGIGLDAWTLKNAYDADGGKYGETFKTEAAGVVGSWAGAASGAAFGATVGTMIAGPAGTVVGGIVGGAIGAYGGTDIGKDAYKSGVFKWWW